MKRTLFTTLLILFFVSTVYLPLANSDSVNPLRRTDDTWRSKAAFVVVNEAIARGLNLHTLSESDYWKLRGPVLLESQTDIHYQLREEFKRIVNTVDFGASLDAGSPSQNSPVRQDNTPVLYEKAADIIRDFIVQKHLSVIIMSDAPIGMGEIGAIRGLRGEVRYTYEIIDGASVSVPLQNIAALIKQPFITEIWPDSKGNLAMAQSIPQIGADNVHNAPTDVSPGLGVTGKGVVVGVVDTGIWSSAPFANRIIGRRPTLHDPTEKHVLHGTNAAGVIGAAKDSSNWPYNGVAPEVYFYDAKRGFTKLETEYSDTCKALEDALKWTSDNVQIDVINLSQNWQPWLYGRDGKDPMSELIDELVDDHEIIVVNSAGNTAEQRVTGVFDPTSSPSNFEHEFNSQGASEIVVTLLWKTNTNTRYDLDLVIMHPNRIDELYVSRNNIDGKPNITPVGLRDDPWQGFYSRSGFVYERIRLWGLANAKLDYIVKVEGYQASGSQKYEVWLERENIGELPPTFHQPHPSQTVGVPGYSKKVITVGAVDRNNVIDFYSSHGPSDTFLIKPEVVAPGTIRPMMVQTSSQKYRLSTPTDQDSLGTSNAAPHVAGVAALILDAVGKDNNGDWNFSPDEVKSAIVHGSDANIGLTPGTPDSVYGAGLVKADTIIFGGTVKPRKKLRFQITPRRLKSHLNYPNLNVIRSYAAAISWENSSGNLEVEFLDQNRNPLTPFHFHTFSLGSNYVKVGHDNPNAFGDFFYLDVVHKDPNGEPIHFTGASTQPIVGWFPDPNLETAIQQEIGGLITRSKLQNLKTLSAENSGIKDLTGLEYARNLIDINLSSNDISDISALSGLTELNVLDLSDNNISNISVLSALTELNVLDLSGNNISDISTLSKLTILSRLALADNEISNISVLSKLTKLNELDLSGNNISDISTLSKLTILSRLALADNEISNISVLSKLTKLNELDLSGNNISDISALSKLIKLSRLALADNEISNISVLSKLTKLNELDLSGNNISDISALAKLTILDVLWLFSNNISDISALAKLTQLEELRLFSNNISDISALAKLTILEELYLSSNSISDLSALSELTQLRDLKLSDNSISDISPLVELGWLKHLNIRTNPLSYASVNTHIPAMKDKGVQVSFQNLTHSALMKISGDMQEGEVGTALTAPLVVEALDADGAAMTDISVTFSVVEGDGHISATTTTTDAKGRAQTTLTLGPNLGPNKVRVTAIGIIAPVTFTATTASLPEVEADLPNGDKDTTKWGLPDGAKRRLGKGTSILFRIAYSADGTRLAVASSIGIWIYDARTGEELNLFTWHEYWLESASFSPDGQTFASAGRSESSGWREIRLWDVRTGDVIHTLTGHRDSVGSVSFSPDGNTLASGSYDRTIRLWDVRTGDLLHTLTDHTDKVGSVLFSPDGQTLASVSQDQTIRLWDVRTGDVIHTLTEVGSVSFSPDGNTLASMRGKEIHLWDVRTGDVIHTLRHEYWIENVSFSPDGQTLASSSSYDDTIHLWDVRTGDVIHTLTEHIGRFGSVSFSPDGQTLASSSYDQTIRLWGVRLWGVSTGDVVRTLTGHTSNVRSVLFSPDGRTLTSASVKEIHLWDVSTGDVIHNLTEHTGGAGSVSFSPDGQTLASASGREIHLSDVSTGDVVRTLTGHSNNVSSVAFSPDRRTLASSSDYDDTIRLWDVSTGDVIHTLTPRRRSGSSVNSVAFSPDRQTLASGGNDRTIRLWDVSTGNVIHTLKGHTGNIGSVAFSPDGQTLASGRVTTRPSVYGMLARAMLFTPSQSIRVMSEA